ncbi:acyltransferase family protein [Roseibacillus ishigakijimensis]|uniref:Acyltransferase n=1 Tax=Roseibacillus ishigakijimensis TaxID=454146 RepID=A0A934RMB3_9BACT|nr:acyltransferase [Roseibacillus ishigakijimensis]MBK1833425.1 acyltransferase [Roseibacillus ishigakijimensis]
MKIASLFSLSSLRRETSSGRVYYAEIDGLRFVAIFMVLLLHVLGRCLATGYFGEVGEIKHNIPFIGSGGKGVKLFFAISGFIISLKFVKERLEGSRADLRKYFGRRLTRLEPPYVISLLGVYLLAIALNEEGLSLLQYGKDFFVRLFYLSGLVYGEVPPLNAVTWSLEVEILFYILAPLFALVFCSRFPVVVYAMLLGLILASALFGSDLLDLDRRFYTTPFPYLHYFLTGFLLSYYHVCVGKVPVNEKILDVLGFLALMFFFYDSGNGVLDVASLIVIFCAALYGHWFKRALSVSWVSVVGGMCYSIYLIHMPLLTAVSRVVVDKQDSLVVSYVKLALIGLPVVGVASLVFYVLIERPCMNPKWPEALRIWLRSSWKKVKGEQGTQTES